MTTRVLPPRRLACGCVVHCAEVHDVCETGPRFVSSHLLTSDACNGDCTRNFERRRLRLLRDTAEMHLTQARKSLEDAEDRMRELHRQIKALDAAPPPSSPQS